MNKGLKIVMWTLLGLIFVAGFGYLTMALWNWLVPALFNGPFITFWQALGLFALAKILFGGFRGKSCSCGGARYGWKQKYYEKIKGMTPEEREHFKAKIYEKWCSPKEGTAPSHNHGSNV